MRVLLAMLPDASASHRVRRGPKSPQDPRSAHQKLAEKLAPPSADPLGPCRPVRRPPRTGTSPPSRPSTSRAGTGAPRHQFAPGRRHRLAGRPSTRRRKEPAASWSQHTSTRARPAYSTSSTSACQHLRRPCAALRRRFSLRVQTDVSLAPPHTRRDSPFTGDTPRCTRPQVRSDGRSGAPTRS